MCFLNYRKLLIFAVVYFNLPCPVWIVTQYHLISLLFLPWSCFKVNMGLIHNCETLHASCLYFIFAHYLFLKLWVYDSILIVYDSILAVRHCMFGFALSVWPCS